MTRLVWTHSLSSCSGALAWSALVKQTQITAWWVWYTTQRNSLSSLLLYCSILISFQTHSFASTCPKLPQQSIIIPSRLQNDSGSVMVCNGELQGMQWFVNGCSNPAHPSVYTKLCIYNDWIKEVMDRNAPTLPTETTPWMTTWGSRETHLFPDKMYII